MFSARLQVGLFIRKQSVVYDNKRARTVFYFPCRAAHITPIAVGWSNKGGFAGPDVLKGLEDVQRAL